MSKIKAIFKRIIKELKERWNNEPLVWQPKIIHAGKIKVKRNGEWVDKVEVNLDNLKKEYRELKISGMKAMLKDTIEEYKDDPQGLKLFTLGYKEMIKKLEE